MKVTILGTSGGFPKAGGATSGYLLEIGSRHVLIDCGSGVLANLQQHLPLAKLDAILLTHLHHDHISDIQVLKYAIDLSRRYGVEIDAIPLIAPTTPEHVAASLASDGNFVIGPIGSERKMKLFDATLRFYPMSHPVETYGLRVEYEGKVFAYTADSTPCDALSQLLDQADLAIVDAGSLERLRGPVMAHMTAAESARISRESNVSNLRLSHLLPLLDPQEILAEARLEYPQAVLAKIHDSIEL